MATSLNWNINSDSDKEEEGGFKGSAYQKSPPASSSSPSSLFPLHSFSSFGGGDAPLGGGGTLGGGGGGGVLRSQLFTISTTRAVMTTSVNYTKPLESPASPPSSSVDSDIEDFKPINTVASSPQHVPLKLPSKRMKVKVIKDNPGYRLHLLSRSRRCIHGSFEDLLQKMEKKNKGLQSRRRLSDPRGDPPSKMVECCNNLLVEENRQLTKEIERLRRRVTLCKVAGTFTLQALRRKGRMVEELEEVKMDKMRQCAARLILHSLLLNCWRNTRRELDDKLRDNQELKKSVENLALQVQVLRHVQAGERQKAVERGKVIESLEEEGRILREENVGMKKEMEKMEGELNWLEGKREEIGEENGVLREEIKGLEERRDKLVQSLEWERQRSGEMERENKGFKENMRTLEAQLKEATEQRAHWQERARCSESEVWELQLHVEGKEGTIKELGLECEMLRASKMELIEMKGKLKREMDKKVKEVEGLKERNEQLVRLLEGLKEERDDRVEQVRRLETTLEGMRREWREVEKELMGYKLENVRRRRSWGNALYFVVSPMDAMKRKLL